MNLSFYKAPPSRTRKAPSPPLMMSSINNSKLEFETSANMSLILTVVWIVTKVYPPLIRGPTVIGQYADTKLSHTEQNDIMEEILLRITKTPTTRALLEANNSYYEKSKIETLSFFKNLTDEEFLYRLNSNKQKAIWFIDSFNSFKRLETDLLNKRKHFHRSGYFCIVYTGRESDRLVAVRKIFRRLFELYIINVNVLLTSKRTVFIYTYFPFENGKCHNIEPVIYEIFDSLTNFSYRSIKFFPKKLGNMNQCKMKVTTWTELPFVKVKFDRNTGDLISLEGIEGRLLMLIAERMKFAIQIVEEPFGNGGNGTGPGGIKMLKDGLTNITIGGLLYNKARQQAAQPAFSYIYTPLNFGIPLGKMMTPLERLIRPFKLAIWCCLSSSTILGILAIFLLKALFNNKVHEFVFGQGNRMPLTNFWNTFYGGTLPGPLPRRNFARYLLGIWMFYTLILRSAYLAQLFIILQDSRARNELYTVDETLKQNFTFYTYDVGVPIITDATSKQIRIKTIKSNEHLIKLLKQLGTDENAKIAVGILGHLMRAYNQDSKNSKARVNLLRETLLNTPLTLYMRKHSYLTNQINEHLLNIMSSGLINRFEQLYITQPAHESRKAEIFDSIPLSLLTGLFLVHLVLLTLSTVVFLLELWSMHSPITRRIIDFFNI